MSGILQGKVTIRSLELVGNAFNGCIETLMLHDISYEDVLCGMSVSLARLAADHPPDDNSSNEYIETAMAAVMQAVKDIVTARENGDSPTAGGPSEPPVGEG